MDGKVGQVLDVAMPIGAAVASTYGPSYAQGAAIGARMWSENRERYDVKKQGKRLAELIPELEQQDLAAQTEVYRNVVDPLVKSGNWDKDPATGQLIEVKQEVVPPTDVPGSLLAPGMGFPMVNRVPTGQTFDAKKYAPKPSMNWEMAREAAKAGDVLTARSLILEGQQEVNNTRLKAMDIAQRNFEEDKKQKFAADLQAAGDAAAMARMKAQLEAETLQKTLDREEARKQFTDKLKLDRDTLDSDEQRWKAMYSQQQWRDKSEDVRGRAALYLEMGGQKAQHARALMDEAATIEAELISNADKLVGAPGGKDPAEEYRNRIDSLKEQASALIGNARTDYASMTALLDSSLIEGGDKDKGIGLDDLGGGGGGGEGAVGNVGTGAAIVSHQRGGRLSDLGSLDETQKREMAGQISSMLESNEDPQDIVNMLVKTGFKRDMALQIVKDASKRKKLSESLGAMRFDNLMPSGYQGGGSYSVGGNKPNRLNDVISSH